ncbi:MAG: hypothetical protein SGILL_007401 [Bacillariaceae sp.]
MEGIVSKLDNTDLYCASKGGYDPTNPLESQNWEIIGHLVVRARNPLILYKLPDGRGRTLSHSSNTRDGYGLELGVNGSVLEIEYFHLGRGTEQRALDSETAIHYNYHNDPQRIWSKRASGVHVGKVDGEFSNGIVVYKNALDLVRKGPLGLNKNFSPSLIAHLKNHHPWLRDDKYWIEPVQDIALLHEKSKNASKERRSRKRREQQSEAESANAKKAKTD